MCICMFAHVHIFVCQCGYMCIRVSGHATVYAHMYAWCLLYFWCGYVTVVCVCGGVLLCSCVCVWKWGWWSTSCYWMARKNHPCTPPPVRSLTDLTWCGQPHPKCPTGLLPNTHTQTWAHLFFLYWNIIDLQCCVSFRCTAKWFNCICIYMCVCIYI